VDVRVVLGDGAADLLEQYGFACLGSRYDEAPLPSANGSNQVDDSER
jgi:hypothetical protein